MRTRCSRPLSWVSIARASASSRGLPRMKPSHSATVSAARMMAVGLRAGGWGLGVRMAGSVRQLAGDGGRLAVGQFGDQAGWAGFAADAAFDVLGRWHDGEFVAGLAQQLAAPRRTAGEDEAELGAGDWGLRWRHDTLTSRSICSSHNGSIEHSRHLGRLCFRSGRNPL